MKILIHIIILILIVTFSACTPGPEETPISTPQWASPTSLPIPTQIPGEGNADVIFVRADYKDDGTWTFSVTIRHPDTGWKDYANGWDVILADGTVLLPDADTEFTRLLLHPHIDEQPFTRSQNGIIIPESERYVSVRAHDLADGFGGQVVVVDLMSAGGDMFEVNSPISKHSEEIGLTYHNPDGNRYVSGAIDLHQANTLDIPLNGVPEWIVGVPISSQEAIWLVSLEDGSLQAFQVDQSGYKEVPLAESQIPPGAVPAIRSIASGIELLNSLGADGTEYSHPVIMPDGSLAYINNLDKLLVETAGKTFNPDVFPLFDGRILFDETGNLLFLSDPTAEYDHAVLGDAIEAESITLVRSSDEMIEPFTFPVPQGTVIEGLSPIWTDLDEDGQREIIVTLSDPLTGARLAVFSEDGELIAQSHSIGMGFRWRHQIAAAPFGPEGQIEIADVLTPHIGGVVEFFQMQDDALVLVAQVSGYSSHLIGSRNLDMAMAADVNQDGKVELLVPNQLMNALGVIQRTSNGAEVLWEEPLDGRLNTNLGAVKFNNGSIAIAAGIKEGFLRIWMP